MSATVKGMEDAADQLEHRIVEQEDAIHTMENRNYFSLYCLQMETQLIHANMEMLTVMLRNMTDLEIKKHNEVRHYKHSIGFKSVIGCCGCKWHYNRPFSYSENECGSNDISLQFEEFSNVHNCDRSSNATRSNLAYKIV